VPDATDKYLRDTRSPLARLLGEAVVPHRAFAFAGAGGRFGDATWAVRALSADERSRSIVDATKWLIETCKWDHASLYSELGEAVLDLESKVRGLAAALVDPADPTKPFVKDADELRKLLEADEIGRLFEELADYTDERSPFSRAARWQEVEGFVEALGKGWTTSTSLSSYDAASLRFMLRELATRHCSRTSPPSSATTSPSGSSDSSTPTDPTDPNC
jgi:hypothetical protein